MMALFGRLGVVLVSVFVMISSFSSLNGSMLASPRVFFAMADDGMLFKAIAKVHPRFKTPYVAILLAAVLGIALVMSRTSSAHRHLRARHLAVLRPRRRRDLPAAARSAGFAAALSRDRVSDRARRLHRVGRRVRRQLARQRPQSPAITFRVILAGLPVYHSPSIDGVDASRAQFNLCFVYLIDETDCYSVFRRRYFVGEEVEDGCRRAAHAAQRFLPSLETTANRTAANTRTPKASRSHPDRPRRQPRVRSPAARQVAHADRASRERPPADQIRERDWQPSTGTLAPLIQLARGETRNATTAPTSSGRPNRPNGSSRFTNSAIPAGSSCCRRSQIPPESESTPAPRC